MFSVESVSVGIKGLNLASGLQENIHTNSSIKGLDLSAGLARNLPATEPPVSMKFGLHRASSAPDEDNTVEDVSPTKIRSLLTSESTDLDLQSEAWETKLEQSISDNGLSAGGSSELMKSLGLDSDEYGEGEQWEKKAKADSYATSNETQILDMLGVTAEDFNADDEKWTYKAPASVV
jgi:hypothetical protein